MQDVEIIYKFVGAINLPQYGSDKNALKWREGTKNG